MGKTNPIPCENTDETVEASNMYTCGVYGYTVNDRLNAQDSIKLPVLKKTSYKRPSPHKCPVKTGRQFALHKNKVFHLLKKSLVENFIFCVVLN